MKPAKLDRGAVSLTAALTLTLTAAMLTLSPSQAVAQPNPFDAFEVGRQARFVSIGSEAIFR